MFIATAYLDGLFLSAGLIMAIGAQNAHVLRMGLKGEHIGLTVSACILIDITLICLGVAGVGALIQASPTLLAVAKWGGAAFLLWYGLRSWRSVFANAALTLQAAPPLSSRQALASVLALSLLNPHVYLDTVVLLGAIGGNHPAPARPSFMLGAICASVVWFTVLGYGARRLSGWFQQPRAWKCIDAVTGTTMFWLAGSIAAGH
jgi:L-lysine exporter family protein LysE/ArgO